MVVTALHASIRASPAPRNQVTSTVARFLQFPSMSDSQSPSNFSGPLEWYWHFSQRADFESDPEQLKVLERLERLHNDLIDYKEYRAGTFTRILTNLGAGRKPPTGLYIWGGVGRGKSLLMDAFYSVSLLQRKRRVHFHEFMRFVHNRLRELSGKADPLDEVATEIARTVRLLCFDEFHVSDIADAMILGRLFTVLFERGVVIVATSNYKPDDLYPNGLQRSRFLPAIETIKENLEVIEVLGLVDHRQRILESMQTYFSPLDAQAQEQLVQAFDAMSRASASENGTIEISGRPMQYRKRSKSVIWFHFDELCRKPRSQVDFLEIAAQFPVVVIEGIAQLNMQSESDVVRRLTWMVDVFYDQTVKLIASAAVAPEQLVLDAKGKVAISGDSGASKQGESGELLHVSAEFARCASRLREMQSREYHAKKRLAD
jgi:cell division protein ZapE